VVDQSAGKRPRDANTDDGVDAGVSPPTTSPLHDLGGYIRHQREGARLSLRHLAKIAGVSNPYLSQIERGLRKPSAEILQAIAKALEISSETLYVKAGILEEREPSEDLETVIARDPHLTAEQRQSLTEMYRSFRQLTALRAGPDARSASRLRGLLDVVGAGTVDDDAIREATPGEETEDSA
jgi:transcriptional regulator with XRE-family HTH domain